MPIADTVKLANSLKLEETLDELEKKYGRQWVLAELYNWEHSKRA